MQVLLYTTLGCHLCELAAGLAGPVCEQSGYELIPVEIADSEGLIERYGVRIPVIAVSGYGPELGWPFDSGQLRAYLDEAARTLK